MNKSFYLRERGALIDNLWQISLKSLSSVNLFLYNTQKGFMKIKVVSLLSSLFFLSSLEAMPHLSVSPMFLQIASGGVGRIEIKNTQDVPIEVSTSVIDKTGLESERCHIAGRTLNLNPLETLSVSVQCEKNRGRELHFLAIDYSIFQKREVRRIVLY
ncbi:hypothetical protein [Photobacterium galatheae]|nr:hypothetical protein [Photobacterium galatheae]